MERITMRSRENWIDNIKIFACILVALGHFFQSMCAVGITEAGALYQWFNRTVYYFHVPLFFICSGYIYQQYSRIDSFPAWKRNAVKKLVVLGVPYFAFSLVTWGFKKIFSGEVNNEVHGLAYDLFVHPMSPYWFLFAIFFMFLVTGTFRNKKMCCVWVAVALLLKLISNVIDCYVVKIVFDNQIWFVIGMAVCVFDFPAYARKNKWWAYVLVCLFVLLSFTGWKYLSFPLGLMACCAVVILFANADGRPTALAEYTMPVYLMHTIFAAGVRAVLLKLGIDAPAIHIVVGLGASIAGPIAAAEVMKKLKLDILYQPGKYIKINK